MSPTLRIVTQGIERLGLKDFDISGAWDTMIPDAEIISLACTILKRLDVGDFTIKVSWEYDSIALQANHAFFSSITGKYWTVFSKFAACPPRRFAQFLRLWTNLTRYLIQANGLRIRLTYNTCSHLGAKSKGK